MAETIARELRRAARLGGIAMVLLLCLPIHGVARACGRAAWGARLFLRLVGRVCGLDVAVTGTPLLRHVLVAANHASWLDIVALGGATGGSFVAKAEIARWPVVGLLARAAGTIFIVREARGDVRGQGDTLAAALARGRPALLFPEGTTGGEGVLLPFRASLLAAVAPPRSPGLRVQPVAIDYGDLAPLVAWPREESFGANALRLLARPGRIPVTLRFLTPIDPSGRERKALAALARDAVAAALSPPSSIPYRSGR